MNWASRGNPPVGAPTLVAPVSLTHCLPCYVAVPDSLQVALLKPNDSSFKIGCITAGARRQAHPSILTCFRTSKRSASRAYSLSSSCVPPYRLSTSTACTLLSIMNVRITGVAVRTSNTRTPDNHLDA